MKNLLQSELRKLIYLRANWLLLLWSGLFAALGTVAPIMVLNSENNRMGFSGTNTPEGINAVFSNAAGGYLFALIMGILIMTNEYRHGTAVGTFLVTPKRSTVLFAKLIAAALAGLVVQIFSYIFAVSSSASFLIFSTSSRAVSIISFISNSIEPLFPKEIMNLKNQPRAIPASPAAIAIISTTSNDITGSS